MAEQPVAYMASKHLLILATQPKNGLSATLYFGKPAKTWLASQKHGFKQISLVHKASSQKNANK